MENHMVRQHYGRRPVVNKRRRRAPGPGGGHGLMPLMARQLLICSLLFLLILICKNLNLSATNYVTQNVKYVLGHHVELKSVFSYVGELANDIRDSIAPVVAHKTDTAKSPDVIGTPETGNAVGNGTASVPGLDLIGGTEQNAANTTTPVSIQTPGATQASGADTASINTRTSGATPASSNASTSSNAPALSNASTSSNARTPSDVMDLEPSAELQEEPVNNTDVYDPVIDNTNTNDPVSESMPESSVLAASSEEGSHNMSGMVLPVEGTVSSYFSDKNGSNTAKAHKGIDIAVAGKCGVRAVLDGKVTDTGASPAYGSYIRIKHADGLQTVYANCSALSVSKNSIVKKGDIIASIGGTGATVGIHLHFEVWRDNVAVNPLEYLNLPGR